MSRPIASTIILCLVLLTAAQGFAGFQQHQALELAEQQNTLIRAQSPTKGWEYRIESVPDLAFAATMDTLGKDGWDLVFARRAQDSSQNFVYECIFKRPIR